MDTLFTVLLWANVAAFVVIDLWFGSRYRDHGPQEKACRSLIASLHPVDRGFTRSSLRWLWLVRTLLAVLFLYTFVAANGYFRGIYFIELLGLDLNAYG